MSRSQGGGVVDDDGQNLGLLCWYPYRAMEARVMQALAAQGFDDVTLAQSRVLQRVAPQGVRLTELADRARVTKQTAGFLVDQLEKAGYVERVTDPTDARARLVRVAARGLEASAVAGTVVAEIEAEWAAHLGRREAERLRRTLTRLREITDPFA
jgi:DNA-binding MarR family transcriptional regulator